MSQCFAPDSRTRAFFDSIEYFDRHLIDWIGGTRSNDYFLSRSGTRTSEHIKLYGDWFPCFLRVVLSVFFFYLPGFSFRSSSLRKLETHSSTHPPSLSIHKTPDRTLTIHRNQFLLLHETIRDSEDSLLCFVARRTFLGSIASLLQEEDKVLHTLAATRDSNAHGSCSRWSCVFFGDDDTTLTGEAQAHSTPIETIDQRTDRPTEQQTGTDERPTKPTGRSPHSSYSTLARARPFSCSRTHRTNTG